MSSERKPADALAVSVMIVLCMCWGFNQIAIKVAAAGISPIMQAGLRSLIATALALASTPVHAQVDEAGTLNNCTTASTACTPSKVYQLGEKVVIVDVTAGTGILSRLLADRGARVLAVEPNAAMRDAAAPHPRVQWSEGTAEATGLPDAAVDMVTVAQAFETVMPIGCATPLM